VPLGGHGIDGTLECNNERCPEYDELVTQNDGRSFQVGCGWDVLETGCCFQVKDGVAAYLCLRCEKLLVSSNTATCAKGALKEWKFNSTSKVPLSFRTSGEVRHCGPSLKSRVASNSSLGDAISTTSNMFLCNVRQWEQGDYIDDASLHSEPGIGADTGLKSGRHTRINYNNYQRSGHGSWVRGPEIQGEGIFECWNRGSCIAPDVCSCKDGYGGFDCATPLCRHEQATGEIVGCINGVCIAKDECQCIQQVSILWEVHQEAERGLTGWTGTDCSMPMCMQGYYDPFCDSSAAPGNEGCYRCSNGGICVGPDLVSARAKCLFQSQTLMYSHYALCTLRKCLCAEGWAGYDCRTPVCKAEANALIQAQLMTNDEVKIRIFEEDPCGMVGFSTLRYRGA
jgi:hypothetical protein